MGHFPYSIIYQIQEEEKLLIVAVCTGSANPITGKIDFNLSGRFYEN